MGELENHELPNIEKEYGREVYLHLLKKYKPIIEDLKKRSKHK